MQTTFAKLTSQMDQAEHLSIVVVSSPSLDFIEVKTGLPQLRSRVREASSFRFPMCEL